MKLTNFKNIFSAFSTALNSEQPELSKSFNLYIENNKILALSMIENGYKPSLMEQNKLNDYLAKEALTNNNFIFKYSTYISLVKNDALLNYLSNVDLSIKCDNEKNIFENIGSTLK